MVRRLALRFALPLVFLSGLIPAGAQTPPDSEAMAAYKALRAFTLDGGSAKVSGLVLRRDRAEMTFSGTFYFTKPVLGRVAGAVFLGQGRFHADPPDSRFEKDNLRRILDADAVDSDFETAVLRFTDDSAARLGTIQDAGTPAPPAAQELAAAFEAQVLKETGANAASRALLSLREHETPGFFLAQFDGGKRGRFSLLLDYQGRIPSANFAINGGEKGLIYAHERKFYSNTVWMAFGALEEDRAGRVSYSDAFHLVDVPAYTLTVDLREPRKTLKVSGRIDLIAKANSVSTIPFALGESLEEHDNVRQKKAIRVSAARLGTDAIEFIQEEWEGGFTLLLPGPHTRGDTFSVEFESAGKFINDEISPLLDAHYPLVNDQWYPRHGSLGRSTFDLTFLHRKNYKVASVGVRVKNGEPSAERNTVETVYRTPEPVPLVTFAMGAYTIHSDHVSLPPGGDVPLEFFSAGNRPIREASILAEMSKALSYFSDAFGTYPYVDLRAAFHPFAFGQSFPSLLLLPNANPDNKATYLFISHETAHQWWGNVVSWRSYRDQWLSEGFAEYSGILYTGRRDKPSAARELIALHRESLKDAPKTVYGVLGGKVTDIGPLILGHRLSSIDSTNAYERLIYNKGALVLRMLHLLFSDPATGDDQGFFAMMREFVNRHRNASATTESFVEVASERFAATPVARQFGMENLDWFFAQWVWQTPLPTYRLEYALDSRAGGVAVTGTLFQDNAPEDWTMPVPLVLKFAGGRTEQVMLLARGPRQAVALTLPQRPESIDLDPDMWVLSEKTSTRRR